jgi:hypothetical protein
LSLKILQVATGLGQKLNYTKVVIYVGIQSNTIFL